MKSLTLPTLLLLSSKLTTAADLQDEPQLFSNDSGLTSISSTTALTNAAPATANALTTHYTAAKLENLAAAAPTTALIQAKPVAQTTGPVLADGNVAVGLAARRQTENVVPGAIIVGLGSNVGYGTVIMFVVPLLVVLTETETATVTSAYTTAAPTVTYLDWNYYYTTVYWTYWFYFWTSIPPYTVQTVTSTYTTTRTIWSVLETNSAEASASLSSKSARYTFSVPYSATSLKSSLEPVTLSTADATPSATSINSGGNSGSGSGTSVFGGSAVSVSVSATGVMAAVLAAAIGGLAFGL
ncbi:hypothetical protein PENARI_c004G05215 [Penicillium arizonense]|uniref:Mid2 domain-containing protein n=1 Tax=Penicillium arizonense TaxID=1835702 RepID=A0A1F5LR38_PENAI|nr:hypothetical protein PENARI_c004G05215 [Penicillium arizonense]OGE55566.1 hypothetical protein PENARI_c004G05215 [Penicillium arizonense]